MTWVKLDDGFADHPKLVTAGPMASWLHVCALCYCGRHLTDGIIPKPMVPRLSSVPKPQREADRLVEAGVWEDVGDCYVIHDYHDFQPTREEVLADREAKRAAGKKGAEARWGKKAKPIALAIAEPMAGAR
jgi:hypothetical protein